MCVHRARGHPVGDFSDERVRGVGGVCAHARGYTAASAARDVCDLSIDWAGTQYSFTYHWRNTLENRRRPGWHGYHTHLSWMAYAHATARLALAACAGRAASRRQRASLSLCTIAWLASGIFRGTYAPGSAHDIVGRAVRRAQARKGGGVDGAAPRHPLQGELKRVGVEVLSGLCEEPDPSVLLKRHVRRRRRGVPLAQ